MRTLLILVLATAAHAQYEGYDIFSCSPYVTYRHTTYVHPAYRYSVYRQPQVCAPVVYGYGYGGYGYNSYAFDRYYASGYAAPRFSRPTGVYSVYGEVTGYAPPQRYEDVVGAGGAPVDPWSLLADGDARAALKAFTNEARSEPDEASSKIGYALAAADLGDDHTAIWAMRRAFRFDARGANYIVLDDDLRNLVDDHREYYEFDARIVPHETSFMVAALRFIAHDYDEARVAADRCRENGDRSSELRQLERQLDRVEREAAEEKAAAQELIVEDAGG